MELVLERDAAKVLRKFTPKARAALMARLHEIAVDPFAKHASVTALKGTKDAFRLRQGDWRALYPVDRKGGAVRVVALEPRGDVCR